MSKYTVWFCEDAEYPGDEVTEELTCNRPAELQAGISSLLFGLDDAKHRAAILITVDGKPLKGEL